MKHLFFSLLFFAAIKSNAQSLLDADSVIVVQTSENTFTAMAVTVYKGLSASAIKAIFRDRFEKSNRQKLEFARQAIQFEEKASQNKATFTEITGDTITLDSINLDGDWVVKGGETSLKFSIVNNQSTRNKVLLKILSIEEIIISVDKVGEITFYKQDEKTWLGKTSNDLYKMTLDKPKSKNKQ